jgi:hypothetical protein
VKFSGCKDGFLYGFDDRDVEVFDVHYDYIVWEFFCYDCRNELEEEEIKELTNDTNHIPLSVQLQIESEIDIFEDFWKKDQSQEGEANNLPT